MSIPTLRESVSAISNVKRLKHCRGARKGNISKMEMHLRSQEYFLFSDRSSKYFRCRLASVDENIEAYEILQDRIEEIADKLAIEAGQANVDEQRRTNNVTKESYLDMNHALDTWKIGRCIKEKADDLSELKHLTSSRVLKAFQNLSDKYEGFCEDAMEFSKEEDIQTIADELWTTFLTLNSRIDEELAKADEASCPSVSSTDITPTTTVINTQTQSSYVLR